MKLEDSYQSIASEYMRAAVRSRRAVDRILACVADIAERDEGCARAIATHPEAIAALARCASLPPKLLAAARKRARVATAPYRAPRGKPGAPRGKPKARRGKPKARRRKR